MITIINRIPIRLKTGRKLIQYKNHLLLFIIIFGFIIRLYFLKSSPIDLDEGNYLYSANLINEGYTPFKDYFERFEPLYFYILAFFTRLFGTDLMVSRGITLFSSIGTIYLTYKIGRELYNIYIGLIAAFFFAFSPYVVYSNLVGNFGGIFVFTLSASLYFLILAFKNDKYIHYLLFGLLLGASILLYRLSTVFLLTLPFLFVIIKSSEPLNKLLERTIVAYIGITLSLIPVLVYFTALTDFKYMNATNGIGLILYAYVLFIPVLIFSFILNKYILEKYDSLSKLIGTILITVLIYYSLTQIGSLLSIKERVLLY